MNKLLTWQTKHGVNNRALSAKIEEKGLGCHESMISHYHAGRKRFSPEVALAIEEITNGKVSFKAILRCETPAAKATYVIHRG